MKLRGIDFGNVLGASGVQGFFGEGYWFHHLWHPFGLDLDRVTFVSKTATLLPNKGNMILTKNFKPKEIFPKSIVAKLRKGSVLNAISLSNPGLGALLKTGRWQNRINPFMISIGSVAEKPRQRLEEIKIMLEAVKVCMSDFSAPFGLQINFSCPITSHDPDESSKILNMAGTLGIPIIPKYSIASTSIEAIMELNQHESCDAICVSNSIQFGWPGINWERNWGKVSPLAKFGGGGLSGKDLRPLVCEWISRLRSAGFTKPINGGGGILNTADVKLYNDAGASSIFIGSVAILRPWRVGSIIDQANTLKWN